LSYLYEVNTKDYNKLLHDNITKSYEKAPYTFEKQHKPKGKKIATDRKLEDRMQKFPKKKSFYYI